MQSGTFVLNPIKPRNYPEKFKEMVVKAVVKEGVGIRQASRIFKLSPKTVIAWVREFSKKDLRDEIEVDRPVVELDEMCSFVRSRKNEIWIWLALEVNSRKVTGYAVGDRSINTFKRLWDGLDKIKRKISYTDRWPIT